jgi:hypothetical protein
MSHPLKPPYTIGRDLDTPGDLLIGAGGVLFLRFRDEFEQEGLFLVRAANSHAALVSIARRVSRYECTCADGGPGFQCEVCEAKKALAAADEPAP